MEVSGQLHAPAVKALGLGLKHHSSTYKRTSATELSLLVDSDHWTSASLASLAHTLLHNSSVFESEYLCIIIPLGWHAHWTFHDAIFDVFTAVKIFVEIFCVVTPFNTAVGYQRFWGPCWHLHPEHGVSKVLRNGDIEPQHYTASQPGRPPLEVNISSFSSRNIHIFKVKFLITIASYFTAARKKKTNQVNIFGGVFP
jgi:hypothetical protein